jgi:hypothetical protein
MTAGHRIGAVFDNGSWRVEVRRPGFAPRLNHDDVTS